MTARPASAQPLEPATEAPPLSWHPAGRMVPLLRQGGRVHVVTVGRGPHVLLLHGFLQSSWCWRENLEALGRQFTVHAVCLPGFGWSDKPGKVSYRLADQAGRILALLDALGVHRTHIIGNSLGGALALELAWRAPSRVDRLVLVNPAGSGWYPMSLLSMVQHPVLAPLLHLPGVPAALRLGLRLGAYANLAIDDAFMRRFLEPLRTPGAARAALAVAQSFRKDVEELEPRIASIHQPALLLWGEADRVVPRRAVERVRARLRHGLLELYDCSGHCPMEEEPARFNREVIAFLQGRHPSRPRMQRAAIAAEETA